MPNFAMIYISTYLLNLFFL